MRHEMQPSSRWEGLAFILLHLSLWLLRVLRRSSNRRPAALAASSWLTSDMIHSELLYLPLLYGRLLQHVLNVGTSFGVDWQVIGLNAEHYQLQRLRR